MGMGTTSSLVLLRTIIDLVCPFLPVLRIRGGQNHPNSSWAVRESRECREKPGDMPCTAVYQVRYPQVLKSTLGSLPSLGSFCLLLSLFVFVFVFAFVLCFSLSLSVCPISFSLCFLFPTIYITIAAYSCPTDVEKQADIMIFEDFGAAFVGTPSVLRLAYNYLHSEVPLSLSLTVFFLFFLPLSLPVHVSLSVSVGFLVSVTASFFLFFLS